MRLRFLHFILYIVLTTSYCTAQEKSIFGAKYHYGSVYVHTPNVKNIKGAKPSGIELEYSKTPLDSNSFEQCNCFPRNGIAISLFKFDKSFLGTGTMVSYFIEPFYPINSKLNFVLRAAAGLSYTSNPYQAIKNPENKNYVSYINPYLQIGTGINFNVSPHISLTLMESLQHFSNGGFKEPNRGLNWITTSIGVLYKYKAKALPIYKKINYISGKHIPYHLMEVF